LSWYIKDVSFTLAHHLTKLPLSFVTKDPKAKDRGKHATYEEMIQTWVTYEVVKVMYLFGLSPTPRSNLGKIAPEIEKYILHIESNKLDDDDDDENDEYEEIKNTHEIIFKNTQHSGLFEKCTFASWTEAKWKEDVKYMIPFLLLTWLRQLQQYFKEKKNKDCTWAKKGNYQPHISFSKGESSNPLAVVYLCKPGTKKAYKVESYNDIKPYEPKKVEELTTNVLIPSFEEWALLLLTLPNQTRMNETVKYDNDTMRRWKMAESKIKRGYKFELNDTNYAIEDNMMIENMENMIRAYIALASKTFSSTYSRLKDIQVDLNTKIAQQKGQDEK